MTVIDMALLHLFLALAVQGVIIHATEIDEDATPIKIEPQTDETDLLIPHVSLDDPHAGSMDFLDMFFGPQKSFYTSSSAAKMAHVTSSDKSPEEQLEGIKEIATEITMAIQNEMANLLAYALANCDKSEAENKLRKRRSTESKMDSSELVMRLLKHIKSNNEYQNIAIEKMMTAQEIADKFGIEFNPDPEILNDMAVASNKQAEELAVILGDSCDTKNVTEEVSFVPLDGPGIEETDNTVYVYAIEQQPEPEPQQVTQKIQQPHNHPSHAHHHHHHHEPIETQMLPPPPEFSVPPPHPFGPSMPSPGQDFFPQCMPFEPVTTTTTTIILPVEPEPEPELVGEEFEETVTSKLFVDHETPGESVVNHVMTYTVAEKAHFRAPQIEKLPQQMQYYFYL